MRKPAKSAAPLMNGAEESPGSVRERGLPVETAFHFCLPPSRWEFSPCPSYKPLPQCARPRTPTLVAHTAMTIIERNRLKLLIRSYAPDW